MADDPREYEDSKVNPKWPAEVQTQVVREESRNAKRGKICAVAVLAIGGLLVSVLPDHAIETSYTTFSYKGPAWGLVFLVCLAIIWLTRYKVR